MKRAPSLQLVVLLLAACAAPRPAPGTLERPHGTLEALAAALVENAARRTDVHAIRACLHEFREDATTRTARPVRGPEPGVVGAELEREFLLALANRVHVVESEFVAEAPRLRDEGVDRVGAALAVSHLVVGDWFVRDEALVLSVRLIDVDTHVILAAARGVLPLTAFSDAARAELRGLRTGHVVPPAELAEEPDEPDPELVVAAQPPEPSSVRAGTAPVADVPIRRAPPVEDFASWRARRTGVPEPGRPVRDETHPWRTSDLTRLLRVPESRSLPVVVPSEAWRSARPCTGP